MNAIVSTIDSVSNFIVRTSAGFLVDVHDTFSFKDTSVEPPHISGESSPMDSIEIEIIKEEVSFKAISDILQTKEEGVVEDEVVSAPKNMIIYTSGVDVPIYTNPTIEFDTLLGKIPYGDMLMMVDVRGRFYYVVWNTVKGWVLKEDCVERAAEVYPEFILGDENLFDSKNTLQVRAILNDIFGVGQSEFPMQSGEYAMYKLWKRGINVSWPETRPRVPGLWHKILRGTPNIHIGVMPEEGSIIEYVFDDGNGHLAYVDSVLPDETISISEVNYPDSGIYNERLLTKEEWIELKPVFIQAQ